MLAEAEQRWAICEPVYRAIETAFSGVTLGNGVGLSEGEAIDDWEDEATRASYRANDEKEDWRRIPPSALRQYNDSLTYFDAEGMRFHLPAFLLAYLHGDDFIHYIWDDLTCLSDSTLKQYALLNPEQKGAVAAFMRLEAPDAPDVRVAIEQFWDSANPIDTKSELPDG